MSTTVTGITAQDPLLHVATWLDRHGRRSRLRIAAGTAPVAFAALLGIPFLAGDHYGLRELLTTSRALLLVTAVAVTPLVVWIYFWLPESTSALFSELRANDVIGEASPEDAQRSWDEFERRLTASCGRAWWILAIAVALAAASYAFVVEYPREYAGLLGVWVDSLSVRLVVTLTVWLIGPYMVVLSLVRLVIQLVFVDRLFRSFAIVVHPLHADGAGGLGVVGRILGRWLLLAAALGAVAVGAGVIYRFDVGLDPFEQPQLLFLGSLYVVLLPLLVIGFLWRPHQAMIQARERHLVPLVAALERCLAVSPSFEPDPAPGGRDRAALLRRMKVQHDWERGLFPTWPMPIGHLRRALTTAIVPLPAIVIPLIQAVIPLLQHAPAR